MNTKKIEFILKEQLNLKEVYVTEENNHFKITAIGDVFKGSSQVTRQKMIYKPLINMITKNKIHAISIKSYTLNEWEKNNNL
ncbi:BolA family protein [Buchnera aphidicola]|uniref:BolA family protein n=1 Tax=Buchnera aphidicola TaxID=9 RepID=UPI0034642346